MDTDTASVASILREAREVLREMGKFQPSAATLTRISRLISSALEAYQREASQSQPVASGTTASVNLVVPHATSLTITIQPPAS